MEPDEIVFVVPDGRFHRSQRCAQTSDTYPMAAREAFGHEHPCGRCVTDDALAALEAEVGR